MKRDGCAVRPVNVMKRVPGIFWMRPCQCDVKGNSYPRILVLVRADSHIHLYIHTQGKREWFSLFSIRGYGSDIESFGDRGGNLYIYMLFLVYVFYIYLLSFIYI